MLTYFTSLYFDDVCDNFGDNFSFTHLLYVKQFDDLWKSLFEWLEASEDNLQKFVIGVGVRTKQDFDELRVSYDFFGFALQTCIF